MARPKKPRIIKGPPIFNQFKPSGIPMRQLEQIELSIEEYEAIRLADYRGLDQDEAAKRMEISRPTFTRLIEKARKKASAMFVEGKGLFINGGSIHFNENIIKCLDCGHVAKVNIEKVLKKCEECGSASISDFALKYGHGRCCTDRDKEDQS